MTLFEQGPVILDGATGSNLMAKGMPMGVCPEAWIYDHKEAIVSLQKEYVQAGTQILYAPTFRDSEVSNPTLHLNLKAVEESLAEDEVLLIRLHPHVAQNIRESFFEPYAGKIYHVSDYSEIAALLAVSEVLITDYSSIVFEYCLLERPMLFYAYDLKEFEQRGRNFYRDYRNFVPGPVLESEEALLNCLKAKDYHVDESFVAKNFPLLDGNATSRLFALIFSKG